MLDKHIATLGHLENGNAIADIFMSSDRFYNSLDDADVPREDLVEYLKIAKVYVASLEEALAATCGAHPTLVAIHQQITEDKFDKPECDSGYDCTELKSELHECDGVWVLDIDILYEHDDERGGCFRGNLRVSIEDDNGQALFVTDDNDSCEAGNLEACVQLVTAAIEDGSQF